MVIKTKIIKINPTNPSLKILKKVAKEIRKGKIVVYPTETCYGLATNALNETSVKKIYETKERPIESNLTVIDDSLETAKKYGEINKIAEKLVKKFMPGPLTLVVRRKRIFPQITNKDFAFRISSNLVASKLAFYSKVPITATSANLHRKPSIYSSIKVIKIFNGKVDLILDAGNLKRRKPSTIVDIKDGKIKIVRKGPISTKEIISFLKKKL